MQPHSKHLPAMSIYGGDYLIYVCPTAVFQTDTIAVTLSGQKLAEVKDERR
jgi:hypothetical protein